MIDALIDRTPLLLLLAVLALAAHVAVAELGEPSRLWAAVPAAAVGLLYLRAGRRARAARGAHGGGPGGAGGGGAGGGGAA